VCERSVSRNVLCEQKCSCFLFHFYFYCLCLCGSEGKSLDISAFQKDLTRKASSELKEGEEVDASSVSVASLHTEELSDEMNGGIEGEAAETFSLKNSTREADPMRLLGLQKCLHIAGVAHAMRAAHCVGETEEIAAYSVALELLIQAAQCVCVYEFFSL
jgi:hypothetical protein